VNTNVKRIAGVGIFAALVIVLQVVATFIQFGPFAITLALVPIVIGAALYGVAAGAILGGVFSGVVLIMSITGADPGGYILWVAQPFATAAVIMARGLLAGAAAGLVYRALSKKSRFAGVVGAAVICPIINTGLLLLAMYFIFPYFLDAWSYGATVMYFLFIGMAGVNFVVEMSVNIVLSPVILRILDAVKRA
jgi:uncharacterized membrane protein